jgi:hypothetical protein
MCGAKPPSSPTAVESFLSLSTFLSAWNVSTPARRASSKVSKPSGITMNSCTSSGLSAWAPPLMMFIIGAGRSRAVAPPR